MTDIGLVLGDRYQLDELIGSGAMGRVYKARHTKINRQYAIKLLHTHLLMDPKICRRFAQEAQLASALHHPNVVSVIDVGDSDEGHYIVMELAEGVTLSHVLATAPLERAYAIDLLRQICDGLQHAHELGAIHRDLKPDNIIVDGEGIARIVDFGIATMNDESTDKRERLTTAGLILGTPQYMAPCLATGRPYDHRVDLFALGVIAYEMLTGSLPFDGDGADVVRANVSRATPSMGMRAPTVQVDPLLEAFTQKLMAKAPDDRPPSARAARELLDLVERDPRAAGIALGVDVPMPEPEPEPPVPRRSKRRYGIAALLVLAILGVGYAALRQDEPAPAAIAAPIAAPIVPAPPPPPIIVVTPPIIDVPPERPRTAAHSGSARVARPAPLAIVAEPSAAQLAQLYVAVGQRLKTHPDENLWARFRRIHIQDAMATQDRRNDAARQLGDIDRSLLQP